MGVEEFFSTFPRESSGECDEDEEQDEEQENIVGGAKGEKRTSRLLAEAVMGLGDQLARQNRAKKSRMQKSQHAMTDDEGDDDSVVIDCY